MKFNNDPVQTETSTKRLQNLKSREIVMKDYYSKYCNEYYNRTVSVDSALFLYEFSRMLKPDSHVLDIGCGSGRDLLWLKKLGFRPKGLERSEGLAVLAEKNSGCEVIIADYEHFDFSTIKVDGMLFSASLVHVPHPKIKQVLKNALSALKQDGCLYISVKEGEGTKQDAAGRIFFLWQDDGLRPVFNDLNLEIAHYSRSESVLKSDEVWLGYVLKQI